jgi:hypothetical protein
MTPLAAAIVAFTLGVVLTAVFFWKIYVQVWVHACHCSVCKELFLEALQKHEDTGTECHWKSIVRRIR